MVVYTIWQCLQCGTTILMGPQSTPWYQYWSSPRRIVACCEKPNINHAILAEPFISIPSNTPIYDASPAPKIELPADEETPQHDRVKLVLEDLEVG